MSNSEKHYNIERSAQLIDLLGRVEKKIVVLSHLNPDGDALGSSLGLLNLFTKMGHECMAISPNDYPDFLRWLPGNDHLIVHNSRKDLSVSALKNADIIIGVDFNELKRVKDLMEIFDSSDAFKVLIDHHPYPAMTVDYLMSDTTVSSTAELVYQFIINMGLEKLIDKDIASCLFTGIMTDTGCFSYNSSNRKTWETVASLLDYGIDKDQINSLTYDNYSEHRMRLLGYSLNEKMEILSEFNTGFIALSKEDLTKFHFEPGDSDGFVNYPLSIKGICFSALFTEKDDCVRISFRSKGNFAVNEFSREHFNGGGHRNAAGGEAYANLNDTVLKFKDLLHNYKNKLVQNED